MRCPVLLILVLAAVAGVGSPSSLFAQQEEAEAKTWRIEGLRQVFCVQMLMDPAADALKELPRGYQPVPASQAKDLHVSLQGVVEGQPEFASWSPSRVCVEAVDTVRTDEYTLGDKRGRHLQLFATWTVLAAASGAAPGDVALMLFSNSDRLIRSARLAGQVVREARLQVGLVPAEDENGVPSSDERFLVKVGKTTIIWDGRPARDSAKVKEPVRRTWATQGVRDGTVVTGEVVLAPSFQRAMVGSLKVDGKDDFAEALRASPTRFAGPAYLGGDGSITFRR